MLFIISTKLYRKKQLYELAEKVLEDAKSAFGESCSLLSCSKCRLLLEVTVQEECGDYSRSNFSKEQEKDHLLGSAQVFYESAETNLNDSEWKNTISDPENIIESNQLLCDAVMNSGKGVNDSSCWHCVCLAVLESKSLDSIIQMKWEITRRRRLLGLLIKKGMMNLNYLTLCVSAT